MLPLPHLELSEWRTANGEWLFPYLCKMKALWHEDAWRTIVRTGTLHEPGQDEIHLQSQYSLISLGTELTVARGHVPASLHDSMRVPYMEGEFLFPVKYGYSLVGQRANGTLSHVMHPHQDECLVHADDCFDLPPDIPAKRATLAANLETALTATWDGDVQPGQRVLIVGFGMIGSLIARVVSGIPGTSVVVYDTNTQRKSYAAKFGFHVLEDLRGAEEPFQVAFHSTSSSEGLQTAIDLAGMEGIVVECSWYGEKKVTLALGGDFHTMRKKIVSSQVSNIPLKMQNVWNHRKRKEVVMEMLRNPEYDLHITHEVTLEEAAEFFEEWRETGPDGLGYCIKYQ